MRWAILWAGVLACACSDPFGSGRQAETDGGAGADARVAEHPSVTRDGGDGHAAASDGSASVDSVVDVRQGDDGDARADIPDARSSDDVDAGRDSGDPVEPVDLDSGPPDGEPEDSGTDQAAEDAGMGSLCPGFERWQVEVGECLYIKNAAMLSPTALSNGECTDFDVPCGVVDNSGQSDEEPIVRWITPYNPENNTSVVTRYELADGQCPKTCPL